jgi:hypothetical protein
MQSSTEYQHDTYRNICLKVAVPNISWGCVVEEVESVVSASQQVGHEQQEGPQP